MQGSLPLVIGEEERQLLLLGGRELLSHRVQHSALVNTLVQVLGTSL